MHCLSKKEEGEYRKMIDRMVRSHALQTILLRLNLFCLLCGLTVILATLLYLQS